MKIILFSLPSNNKISEPFILPNYTLALLKKSLRDNGYNNVITIDLEKKWFEVLKKRLDIKKINLLERKKLFLWKNNKLKMEIMKDIVNILGLPPANVLGISMVDLRPEPLSFNLSLLLSYYYKFNYSSKVIIGGYQIGKFAFYEIMKKFKVFDWAVYAKNGDRAFLEILKKIEGKNSIPFNSIERVGEKIEVYESKFEGKIDINLTPYYEKDILNEYTYYDYEILNRYNQNYIINDLLVKNEKFLIVPYMFEIYCPNKCAFCEQNIYKPNLKSIDQVIDELLDLKKKGVSGIYFINSSFNNHYRYTLELCNKMIKYRLNLKWMDCANFLNIDEKLLFKMKEAGAIKLTWGVESGSDRILKYINKGVTLDKIVNIIKIADKLGIINHVELIAGLPYENDDDIENTIDFIKNNSKYIDIYTLNAFYLYQNSYFYLYADKFNLEIIPYDFNKVTFFPEGQRTTIGRFSYKFNEIYGLDWNKKNKQIINSTKKISEAIKKYSDMRKFGNEHVYLLFLLYNRFPYKKRVIRKLLDILTKKFKPYNLDFFLTEFDNISHKHEEKRVLLYKNKVKSFI